MNESWIIESSVYQALWSIINTLINIKHSLFSDVAITITCTLEVKGTQRRHLSNKGTWFVLLPFQAAPVIKGVSEGFAVIIPLWNVLISISYKHFKGSFRTAHLKQREEQRGQRRRERERDVEVRTTCLCTLAKRNAPTTTTFRYDISSSNEACICYPPQLCLHIKPLSPSRPLVE